MEEEEEEGRGEEKDGDEGVEKAVWVTVIHKCAMVMASNDSKEVQ